MRIFSIIKIFKTKDDNKTPSDKNKDLKFVYKYKIIAIFKKKQNRNDSLKLD